MLDWIVNDCGDYIEIIHNACGSKTEFPHIEKRAFLESHFVLSEEGYFSKDSLVLSVREFPNSVKDVLDRIHISGDLERLATELQKKRTMANTSSVRKVGYLILVCVLVVVLAASSPFGPIYPLGALAILFLGIALAGRFQRKYAHWRITTDERLFIRLWEAVKNLQSFVKSGGLDDASYSEAYRLLDVSVYATSVGSSWNLVNESQSQMARVLRNIIRGIRPYVKREKRNIRQFEQLVVPTLLRLLPLLINSDSYSIDAWNTVAERQWPPPVAAAFSLAKLKGLFVLRWIRIALACGAAILAFVSGSPITGVDLALYVKENYLVFWIILIGFLGLVIAPDLIQRGEKSPSGWPLPLALGAQSKGQEI